MDKEYPIRKAIPEENPIGKGTKNKLLDLFQKLFPKRDFS